MGDQDGVLPLPSLKLKGGSVMKLEDDGVVVALSCRKKKPTLRLHAKGIIYKRHRLGLLPSFDCVNLAVVYLCCPKRHRSACLGKNGSKRE